MSRSLMLVPSLACPAGCKYCFGPHEGGATMSIEIVRAVARWQVALGDGKSLDVTFHGGEPLAPGIRFYREALPALRQGLAPQKVKLSMQSNLWLLTEDLCELFREQGISLGTSLDGPEKINDAQRGEGYFRQTMAGIELARRHGLGVGCICTFTAQSFPRAREIFDFFAHEGISFTVHAALPSLRHPEADGWSLSAEAHGELLIGMLDRYLPAMDRLRIGTLDSMCRSVSSGHGGICTFGDCLGAYLAVGPDGAIYPCQRFAGMPEYAIGNVHDCPSQEELASTRVWREFQARQEQVQQECGDCAHLAYCHGGCPYNTLVAGRGSFEQTARDPHCEGYRRFLSHVTDRALEEVFSDENLEAVVAEPDRDKGLLRKGHLLTLMRGGPHPHETAHQARRILMAAALGECGSVEGAAVKLQETGVVASVERARPALAEMHRRITVPTAGLNNLYLHVTFACPLRCAHCYAEAEPGRSEALAVEQVVRACGEGARLGFRHAVITGGEPLVHPHRDALLDGLAAIRPEVKPLLTVLRTSLALPMGPDLLRRVASSADQVVVSLDGDRETHDARRGHGSYDRTVANLRALVHLRLETDLSLATVLPAELANGAPGASVKALARELGIRRTRFRPVLPLGRANQTQPDLAPQSLLGHMDPEDLMAYGFSPVSSCGLGQNIYVGTDGSAYPCYAWRAEQWLLGNVTGPRGLAAVIESERFQDLRSHTVNTNRKCRGCGLRYLCGGACRAWMRLPGEEQSDLDDPPVDCAHLRERAESLLMAAVQHLGLQQA